MVVVVKSVKEQVWVEVVHSVMVTVVTGRGQQLEQAHVSAGAAAAPASGRPAKARLARISSKMIISRPGMEILGSSDMAGLQPWQSVRSAGYEVGA